MITIKSIALDGVEGVKGNVRADLKIRCKKKFVILK